MNENPILEQLKSEADITRGELWNLKNFMIEAINVIFEVNLMLHQ
jgi:hypothetical protein